MSFSKCGLAGARFGRSILAGLAGTPTTACASVDEQTNNVCSSQMPRDLPSIVDEWDG